MEGKLSVKNYFGYMVCDLANGLAFCVMSSYLAVYCSDILGISGGVISAILIIARVWDGINDPIMGFLVQKKKPGKHGKYRPFIIGGGYFLAIAAVLTFAHISDNLTFNTIWVAAFYIIYGMLYTVVLVPYGSLASVMTTKDNERSILSMCRSVGGGIGNLPTMVFPVLVMTAGPDSNQMDERRLLIGMIIIAVAQVILYSLSYGCTKEKVIVNEEPQKVNFFSTIVSLVKNRAFVTMSIIGALVIAAQMYMSTVNLYLFKDYFGNSAMNTVYTIIAYVPMVIMIPFANIIIKKIGKKEICVVGLLVSTIASLCVYLIHFTPDQIYWFIAMAFIMNCGVAFITLEIWSMAADIIDHQEWISGKREEAANYAIFTFMRKVGQAIAALAPWFVSLVGYDSDKAGTGISQGMTVLNGMYNVATLVPFIMYALMFVLMIIYPLDKKTTERMHKELDERRSQYEVEEI